MIKRSEIVSGRAQAAALLEKAHLALSEAELADMEVADFGLGNWPREGAQIATFVGTDRVGFKVICLLKDQSLPEHWHTTVGGEPGKEETLRVIYGTLRLYLEGDGPIREGSIPEGKQSVYSCRRELIMRPPQQITLEPGSKHWMQGGDEGAVLFSISSAATCAVDPFTDPDIRRFSDILED